MILMLCILGTWYHHWTLIEDTVFIFASARVFVFEPRRLDLDEWDIRGLCYRLKRTCVKTALANSGSSDRTSEILFTPNLRSTKSSWANFISIYIDAVKVLPMELESNFLNSLKVITRYAVH
jgi:hypothetical protein